MVDVTKEQQAGAFLVPVPNPLFNGDTKSLVVTKPVHLDQLVHEIDERLGDHRKYQVVVEIADHRAEVSETNPATVHVHPAKTDMAIVQKVVDEHVPDPHYGKTEAQLELLVLKDQLRRGDLALPDLNKILRSMLGS